MKNIKILISSIFLLFFMLACSLFSQFLTKNNEPVIETKEDGSLEVNATAAAQAELAFQTQIAGIEATQQYLIEKVEATAQALRPTDSTNALQGTPTPFDPSSFQTPPPSGVTTVSVSNNTNCRSGPGVSYTQLDIVYVGQEVEVLGVDGSGAYYIVRSPNGSICWLWSHYAKLHGDNDSLTVMTPPALPQGIVIYDWQDTILVQTSKDFSWQGHWVVGAYDGQSYPNWYNAEVGNCENCFQYKYYEIDVVRSGSYLDIELTEHLSFWEGSSAVAISYGLAQLSEDNAIAVGSFYMTERVESNGYTSAWAWDSPILWYQNGNPNQFIGNSYQSVPCGARGGVAFPIPCTWP